MTTATYGYAVLDNLGPNGWSLYIRTGQTIHHQLFTNHHLAEDESPRDRAVRLIAALGWTVAGDGSWQVGAWTGPEADTTSTRIAPTTAPPQPAKEQQPCPALTRASSNCSTCPSTPTTTPGSPPCAAT